MISGGGGTRENQKAPFKKRSQIYQGNRSPVGGRLPDKCPLCLKGHFVMNEHFEVYHWQVFQKMPGWLHYWNRDRTNHMRMCVHTYILSAALKYVPRSRTLRNQKQDGKRLGLRQPWVWTPALLPTCFSLCFSISKNKALGRVLGGAKEMACMRVPSLSPSSGNLGFLPLNWVGGGEGRDFKVWSEPGLSCGCWACQEQDWSAKPSDSPRRRNHKGKNRVNNKEMEESMGIVARRKSTLNSKAIYKAGGEPENPQPPPPAQGAVQAGNHPGPHLLF